MGKPIVYFDMDGTLADFDRYANMLKAEGIIAPDVRPDTYPGIFDNLPVMDGAQEAVRTLSKDYDLFIATTNPWRNDAGASAKIGWIKRYFGGDGPENPFYKHVILTHRKDLLYGDYLIDDWPAHGASDFKGELIQFGHGAFPDWKSVTSYLESKIASKQDAHPVHNATRRYEVPALAL